jgi:hypothetical protein
MVDLGVLFSSGLSRCGSGSRAGASHSTAPLRMGSSLYGQTPILADLTPSHERSSNGRIGSPVGIQIVGAQQPAMSAARLIIVSAKYLNISAIEKSAPEMTEHFLKARSQFLSHARRDLGYEGLDWQPISELLDREIAAVKEAKSS